MRQAYKYTIAATLVVAGIWGSIALGMWKSDDRKFAERTCNPAVMGIGSVKVENDTIRFIQKYASFNDCLNRNFPIGENLSSLKKYINGAGFSISGKISSSEKTREIYIKNVDYEKGPRELLIIIDYKFNEIIMMEGFEWNSANWIFDGSRPKSPFEQCLKSAVKCKDIKRG